MEVTDYIELIEQQRKEQDSIYHNIAVQFGLSDTAMWVLYNVYTSKGMITQQELCHQCFFAKQTVNTAITSLSKNGYVELEVIPGTRNQKKILFTSKGDTLAKSTIALLIDAESRAYSALSNEELERYLEMTKRLTISLREEMEKITR